jgi:hypothetical protein
MRFFREPWAAAQGSQTEILAEQRLFSYRWIGGSPERLTPVARDLSGQALLRVRGELAPTAVQVAVNEHHRADRGDATRAPRPIARRRGDRDGRDAGGENREPDQPWHVALAHV